MAVRFYVAGALFICTSLARSQGTIMTVAGNGTEGFIGDHGPATSAELDLSSGNPKGVAVDSAGNLYIADFNNARIRKVSGGTITTIAGNGIAGFSGDGGKATAAEICTPEGIWLDAAGNVYIADEDGYARKVNPGDIISTLAGIGGAGFSGDNGKATQAGLFYPSGVALDNSGNLFIADTFNYRVRKVSPNGIITTYAGNGTEGYSGDGGQAINAELDFPSAIAVDSSGNLYIADYNNSRIRKVTPAGIITTVAGGGFNFPGDGGPAINAQISFPSGVAVDSSGNIYIGDSGDNLIREVTTDGIINTIAGTLGAQGYSGDGGPATSATLNYPTGVAVDASGNVYFADNGNNVVREILAPPAAIRPGGIVPVYSTSTTIQPGSWISIFGFNLAPGEATWNNDFPTTLGGVSVTIDGKPAYLWYVSPSQINLQAPDDPTLGTVNVVVQTPRGAATSTVTLAPISPSFSLLDGKHVAGIILRSDGSGAYDNGAYDILGPTGNSLGYATVAAKAGDNVELFGVGFGPTTPQVQAGQPFSGQAPTTNTVQLTIGAQPVMPSFAGLSSAGLYQINLTIPANLGTGDEYLFATVGGIQTQYGVLISLQ